MPESSPSPRDEVQGAADREGAVVLVGNPNVGKSALFGALTGRYATVSNYPGTTVELLSGNMILGGERVRIRDTPGVHSLIPSSEDERVTRDILLEERPRAVVVVGDSKNLDRTLVIALQMCEAAIPWALCLNMMDEAAERGIAVDRDALSSILGIPVVGTVATRRVGISRLREAISTARSGADLVSYPEAIETEIRVLAPILPAAAIAPRALALMILAGDETLAEWLRARSSREALSTIESARQRVRASFHEPVAFVIQEARTRAAWRLASAARRQDRPGSRKGGRAASALERVAIHPVWGVPVLGGVLVLAYLFVGIVGAGVFADFFEEVVFGRWINPWAVSLSQRFVPWQGARDFLVGPYGFVTMALTYSLALVLPIVTTFFVAFGLLEDSGYLPRLAVIVNRGFKRMGLNGRAVLPMVLGLGCGTMATMTTRILETSKERLIVIVLLALGVPCSAQLTVVLAMLAPLSPLAPLIWLGVVGGVIVLVGSLAARVLPGRGSDFVCELPPMRLPRARNLWMKTVARVEWYLKEAVPLFVVGTLILFVADRVNLLRAVERAAEPVLSGALGLPRECAEAFVIGFLRRDFGAAGLYRMAEAGALSPEQVLVAVVTMTLFLPCIANFFMIVKERGWKVGTAVAAFVLPFALCVGAALNGLLKLFPVPLR